MKKNILLVVIALALALGIAEFVVRVVGLERVRFREVPRLGWVNVPENIWMEYHPVLGWYAQKNKTATLISPNFAPIEVHTNAAGFRGGRDYLPEKRAGIIRIAVLGDSFVFGFGVQDTESFPALLELSGLRREVLNLGVPGYGIDQIYLSYQEIAKKYHPDVVLIGIFPEDFWRCTRSFADSGHVKPYFSIAANGKLLLHNVPVPPRYSLSKDQFPPIIESSTLQKILNASVLYRLVKKPLIKLMKNVGFMDPDTTEEGILGRIILQQLIQDIRRDQATPVIVLIPPKEWVRSARKTSLEKSMHRFAVAEKVDIIDLKQAFRDAVAREGLEKYYIANDWHWTSRGQSLAAQTIEMYFAQGRVRI